MSYIDLVWQSLSGASSIGRDKLDLQDKSLLRYSSGVTLTIQYHHPSNDGPASICSQITAKRVGADKMLTQDSVAAVRRDRVILGVHFASLTNIGFSSSLIPPLTQSRRPLTSYQSSIMPWTNTRNERKLIYSLISSPPGSNLATLPAIFSLSFNSKSRARISPKVPTNAGQDGLSQP